VLIFTGDILAGDMVHYASAIPIVIALCCVVLVWFC